MKNGFKRTLRRMIPKIPPLPTALFLDVEPMVVPLSGLPAAFDGARVAVVADTHFPDCTVEAEALVRCVALQRPDAVFLPGDLTNFYAPLDEDRLRRLAQGLAAIAPCFAVPGNHERRGGRLPQYREILTDCGVRYMEDSFATWEKDGQSLRLFGMNTVRPHPLQEKDQPAIVLAHKPQYFSYYVQAGWDLVVCGHAHGGQIRLGGKGIYSPGQGLFPDYTGGIYREKNTTMVVSRGIGNSSVPVRLGNKPHLPLLILQTKKEVP